MCFLGIQISHLLTDTDSAHSLNNMTSGVALQDQSLTLYNIALKATCTQVSAISSTSLKLLPPALLADVLTCLVDFEQWDHLYREMVDIVSLVRILKYAAEKRQQMIHCISVRKKKEANEFIIN